MTLELKNTVINSVVLVKKFASVSPPLELTTKLRDVPAGIKMTKIDVQSTSLPPHFVQLARYKLEFLRRNPSYLKSYEKLQKTLIKKYSDWAPHDEMTPEEIDFCKKWKIGNVFAPGKSYDEWTDNETVGMCSDGTERKKRFGGLIFTDYCSTGCSQAFYTHGQYCRLSQNALTMNVLSRGRYTIPGIPQEILVVLLFLRTEPFKHFFCPLR